jgi:hypothetical protein
MAPKLSLDKPNSKGNIPQECPMVLKIPILAKKGITGQVSWGPRFSMSVKEEKDGRKECTVIAGATNYGFDCLKPTAATTAFLRQLTDYSTVEEEAARSHKLDSFHKVLANSGQPGQQWVFGNLLAARVDSPHWQKFRRLAVQSGVRSKRAPVKNSIPCSSYFSSNLDYGSRKRTQCTQKVLKQ